MPQVFICFAAPDKPIADYIARLLQTQGVQVLLVQSGTPVFDFSRYDTGIVILNTHTSDSTWAMFATAQAILQHKPIIPIEVTTVDLLQFPFIILSQPLDFTEPNKLEQVIHQLFSQLDLQKPSDAIKPLPKADTTLREKPLPQMDGAGQKLFFNAVELSQENPFVSLFLFEALLTVHPDYAQEQARHYIEQEKVRLRPDLLTELQAQIEAAFNKRHIQWAQRCIAVLDDLKAPQAASYRQRLLQLQLTILHEATQNAIREAAWDTVENHITAIVAMDSGTLHESVVQIVAEVTKMLLEKGQIAYARTIAYKLVTVSDNAVSREMLETILQQQIKPLIARGEQAMQQRQGQDALKLAEEALAIKGEHQLALSLKERAQAFLQAQAMYEQAKVAKAQGHKVAMEILLLYATQRSSEFGDPDHMTIGQAIQPGFVGHLRELGFLEVRGGVNCMAMNEDGSLFATGARDKWATVWSLPDCGEIISFDVDTPVRHIAISPDGRFVATIGGIADMKLWEVATGRELYSDLKTRSVAFSPDSQHFAIGQLKGAISIHAVANPHAFMRLPGHKEDSIEDLAFSPDGRYLASASIDYTVILWDLSHKKKYGDKIDLPYRQLKGHPYHVRSIAFNSDASLLYTASEQIFVWDVETGENKSVIRHGGSPVKLRLSALDRILAVRFVGLDGIVLIRTDIGAVLRTLNGHESMITDMLFARDDTYLMTATIDGVVRFWGFGKGLE